MLSNSIGFSDADAAALTRIVREVARLDAEIAAARAARARLLAEAAEIALARGDDASGEGAGERDMAVRAVAAEIAAAARASDRTVQRELDDALTLTGSFPETLDAWQAGAITQAHVRLVTEIGATLPPEHRAEFDARAASRCHDESPGRLRGELTLLAHRLHPETPTARHERARCERRITSFPLADGMSGLTLIAPTLHIEAITDRLTRQARAWVDARGEARARVRARARSVGAGAVGVAGAGAGAGAAGEPAAESAEAADALLASDERTLEQLRVDILADLLLAGSPALDPGGAGDGPGTLGAIRAHVQVTVPALTLLGVGDEAGDLAGVTPIDAETARTLAGATPVAWQRILTHPTSGQVLAADSRFAQGPLRSYLRARDRHCRFPGCRVPAIRCEVDHTRDWAQGGSTDAANLAHLCQRHHSMKQFTPWRVRQRPGGILEWTSPLGTTHTDHPPGGSTGTSATPGVRFAPAAGPVAGAAQAASDPGRDVGPAPAPAPGEPAAPGSLSAPGSLGTPELRGSPAAGRTPSHTAPADVPPSLATPDVSPTSAPDSPTELGAGRPPAPSHTTPANALGSQATLDVPPTSAPDSPTGPGAGRPPAPQPAAPSHITPADPLGSQATLDAQPAPAPAPAPAIPPQRSAPAHTPAPRIPPQPPPPPPQPDG